ncbi:sulfate adenylyltransferase subunit 1 [Planctomycetota bacterium]
MENMKIVLVGHVDHGKSTLIGRLFFDTGSLPPDKMEELKKISKEQGKEVEFSFLIDHLQEERDQAVTIDTAQTFFRTDKRSYTIIDAPGHKEFMKNMITGASQAETSLLIVDAKEGIQEQTKRHAYILSMFNLKRNIVVINKMDLVKYKEKRFNKIKEQVKELLADRGINPSCIIPASAKLGDNFAEPSDKLKWHEGPTVLEALDSLEKEELNTFLPFRMPVQDVYSINGKTIIAGRIEAGAVKEGDTVLLLPDGTKLTVDTIEEFETSITSASAGESIGLTFREDRDIIRGNMLSDPDDLPVSSEKIRANLFWMSPRPLACSEEITFRCTTQEMSCRIGSVFKRIDSSTLEILEKDADTLCEHEVGEIEIELTSQAVIEDFNHIPELGRFVLERDDNIVAGGIITLDN